MSPWHQDVMLAFDTETTSADPESARLVTACIATIDGAGVIPPEAHGYLIDPGVDIPAEATAVHGITTEHAREHGEAPGPAISDIISEITLAVRGGMPVIAYNAPFDLTVLDRESRRHGIDPPFLDQLPARVIVIDPLVLDKHLDPYRKGSRTLSAACEHYGVRIDGAHDAAADAIAAARVAWVIAKRHPAIAEMAGEDLHALQVKAKAEQAASFQDYLRRQGKTEVIDGSWPFKPLTGEVAA